MEVSRTSMEVSKTRDFELKVNVQGYLPVLGKDVGGGAQNCYCCLEEESMSL